MDGHTTDGTANAGAQAGQAAGTAQEKLGAAMDMAGNWRETVVEFTKDKPLTALLVAVSAGFALRMMTHASRR